MSNINITYEEAISDRNTLLYRFARDHGRLPENFPLVYLDPYGCILLHRWMIRKYYGVEVSFSSLTAQEITGTDNRELDTFARLEVPRFEELMVLTRSIYLADSEGPIRAIHRLRRHVEARANFSKCDICWALRPRTSLR